MQTNTGTSISPDLLGHFATFESRGGLFRMQLRLSLRRLAWKCIVNGADAAKRVVDIIGSVIALIALSPVLGVIAAIVRLDGGPAFFAQTRVGRHGRRVQDVQVPLHEDGRREEARRSSWPRTSTRTGSPSRSRTTLA